MDFLKFVKIFESHTSLHGKIKMHTLLPFTPIFCYVEKTTLTCSFWIPMLLWRCFYLLPTTTLSEDTLFGIRAGWTGSSSCPPQPKSTAWYTERIHHHFPFTLVSCPGVWLNALTVVAAVTLFSLSRSCNKSDKYLKKESWAQLMLFFHPLSFHFGCLMCRSGWLLSSYRFIP